MSPYFLHNFIMPKSKRPPPRKSSEKSSTSVEGKENALTLQLCDLAIELVEREDGESMSAVLQQKASEFQKLIRKCLYQKKDVVLYEALERAQYADGDAWRFLKDSIEEASATIVMRRGDVHDSDSADEIEVNAFVIPLFVRSTGGLQREQCFQDDAAFMALSDSFKAAKLESPQAKVVLISHAYHMDEIDSITYCHLNDMVRNAMTSMTEKKIAPTPAIAQSIAGWPDNLFDPEDQVIELRFLLGFALKSTADAFYQVPENEAEADAYFELREERFQDWTLQVAPLLQRCLAKNSSEIEVNFLYQDLFHGGKETGIAEYFMLQMMSELNSDLEEHGMAPEDTVAIIGPADVADALVLRVNLYAEGDGALLASSDKPLGVAHDLLAEIADMHDALATIGVKSMSMAMKFDAEGKPVDVRPLDLAE